MSDPAGIKGSKDIVAALQAIQTKGRAIRLARRQVGHACGGARALETGRHRNRDSEGPLVSRDRAGHGGCAQHGGREQRLCALRPRHLAVVQESRRSRHRRRGRPAAVQPIRRDPRRIRRSIRPSRRISVKPSSTGCCPTKARRRSPATRSTASSCSSPTPTARHRDSGLPNGELLCLGLIRRTVGPHLHRLAVALHRWCGRVRMSARGGKDGALLDRG